MSTINRFVEIISWQEARALNKSIGNFIDNGRFKHSYRLISQVEASAGSIMDNIAEGFERSGNKEFIQFLYIAKGSCGVLRSQLCRALDREYINQKESDKLSNHAMRISSLVQKPITALQNSDLKGTKYKPKITDN